MEREVAAVRKMLDLRLIELIQSVDDLRRAVEALDGRRVL